MVEKTWEAFVDCVQSGGELGFVQPIGAVPNSVAADDTEVYGVGAFLLTANELLKMNSKEAEH